MGLGREFQRLAAAGLSSSELLPAVADRIAQVIPHDGCCVSSVDPRSSVLVDTWTEGIPASEFIEAFYEVEHGAPDYACHEELVAGRDHAAILGALTRGEPSRSRRYRRLLAPMGIEHELRAAALDGGAPWGFVHLYRHPGRRDFDASELAGVQRAAPMLAAALRIATARGSDWPAGATRRPEPALGAATILVDRDLRIVGRAGPAEEWLEAMRDPWRPSRQVPVVVMSLVLGTLLGAAVKRVRVLAPAGAWWLLSAARLEDPAHLNTVAVTVVPARGGELEDVRMLALGLTPGERRVCELVLEGASTKLIAQRLHLSTYTVQDRLKAVFAKAQVASRGELAALLRE